MIMTERKPVSRMSIVLASLIVVSLCTDIRAQVASIPAETEVVIRTSEQIDTREADQNQEYVVVLDEPLVVDGKLLAEKGAEAVLQVTDASGVKGVRGRASLILQLTAVTISGRRVPVTTASVKSEGGSQAGRAAKAGIGGAALGAVVGGILGGKSGAVTGAAFGGGAAVGAIAITGQHIKVPAETRLTFVLADNAPL